MKSTDAIDRTCEAAALYALGDLPEREARRFEQRLDSGCPLCQAELDQCQQVAENLLLAVTPVQPAPSLENRLMARIGFAAPSSASAFVAPKIVRSTEGKWKEIAPGVNVRLLHENRTMLVRMEAGARYPSHPHKFDEQCLVLEGSIEDTEGNRASAGDFIVMEKGTTHPPILTTTGALFLVAYT